MSVVTPFWFNQRQGKAEAKGTNCYLLTAPNLAPFTIQIEQGADGLWSASLSAGDNPTPIAVTEAMFPRSEEAWQGAFELYRQHVVL